MWERTSPVKKVAHFGTALMPVLYDKDVNWFFSKTKANTLIGLGLWANITQRAPYSNEYLLNSVGPRLHENHPL